MCHLPRKQYCHSRESGKVSKKLHECRQTRERSDNPEKALRMKKYYVYILSSKRNGTLYTGVTSDIIKRVYEHKQNVVEGFTKKYNIHVLVWYEIHDSAESAINREKQMKKWKRTWKLRLIEKDNPEWIDLYESIC